MITLLKNRRNKVDSPQTEASSISTQLTFSISNTSTFWITCEIHPKFKTTPSKSRKCPSKLCPRWSSNPWKKTRCTKARMIQHSLIIRSSNLRRIIKAPKSPRIKLKQIRVFRFRILMTRRKMVMSSSKMNTEFTKAAQTTAKSIASISRKSKFQIRVSLRKIWIRICSRRIC